MSRRSILQKWLDNPPPPTAALRELAAMDLANRQVTDQRSLASALRDLAGPEDGTPDGRLRAGVDASVQTMNVGVKFLYRDAPAELRMKHYIRLRNAILALADEMENQNV